MEYNFDGNTEGFPVVTSDYESHGQLNSTMIVVTDYSKFREEPGCKKGTHLGVSGRGAEGIT